MWRLPIQNHLRPFFTEKRSNKVKHRTWNSIRFKFVKKISSQNSVKSLWYIKYYSSSGSRPVKIPSNSIRYNYQEICSWSRRPKAILEITEKGPISPGDQQAYYLQLFQKLDYHRKKTNRTVVFSGGPFPNILKYLDHGWDFPAFLNTRLQYKTHIEEFS